MPGIRSEIINDIVNSNAYYSLIICDSPDVSVYKYFCICIRCCSSSKSDIITEYLGIVSVVSTTSESLYEVNITVL